MQANKQIVILVLLLATSGLGLIAYKHLELGFPLFAGKLQTVWKIEARLDFDALGGEVLARVNVPEAASGRHIMLLEQSAPGYKFEFVEKDSDQLAQWSKTDAVAGAQSLYFRTELYFTRQVTQTPPEPIQLTLPMLEEGEALLLKTASQAIRDSGAKDSQLVLEILHEINNPASAILGPLLHLRKRRAQKNQLAIDLLALQGMPSHLVQGVVLEDRQSNRAASPMLQVLLNRQWLLFDPRAVSAIPQNRFIAFQEGDAPLFEVYGGENSRLSFSLVKERRAAFMNAVEDARKHRNWLVDFSIYSLPVAQQSTFKLLLLIPLGALVVVILRNLVGIRTSGTFMPILIALSFLQTTLLAGLALFLLVVAVGLLVRSYLTRLNLLLVPRIASVIVFVIIIYAAIGIAGHKLGYDWALKVTFFPMIILSWTIERMSILWDEEGPAEVLLQGGGSLLTASLAFLLMSNQIVADAIFLYPEVLLIVLAVIISIGSYSGYRLSDLRRFEPMERH